ncbi:MAG: hypothetical protein KDB86_02895 [Actinobacteria bacterium]|nr:hypothetical protein [Actinomycetota bacterium]MCB9388710.1 hypothetical protein [Acidimicrobiia bacterium]
MLASLRDRLLILCLGAAVAAVGFVPMSAGAVAQNCVAPGLFDFYADVPIPLSGPGSLKVGETGSYSLVLDFAAIGQTAGNAAGTGRNISGVIAFPDGVDVTNINASGPGGATATLSGSQLTLNAPGPITIPPYPKFTITFDLTPTSEGDKTIRSVSGSLTGNLTAPMAISATVTCKAVSDASRGATTAIRTISVSGQVTATTEAAQTQGTEAPVVENVASTEAPATAAGSSSTVKAADTTAPTGAADDASSSTSQSSAATGNSAAEGSSTTQAARSSTTNKATGSSSSSSSSTGSASSSSSAAADLATTGSSSTQTALFGLLMTALGASLVLWFFSTRRANEHEQ